MKLYRINNDTRNKYAGKLFTLNTTNKTILIKSEKGDIRLEYRDIVRTPDSCKIVTVHYTICGTLVSDNLL